MNLQLTLRGPFHTHDPITEGYLTSSQILSFKGELDRIVWAWADLPNTRFQSI